MKVILFSAAAMALVIASAAAAQYSDRPYYPDGQQHVGGKWSHSDGGRQDRPDGELNNGDEANEGWGSPDRDVCGPSANEDDCYNGRIDGLEEEHDRYGPDGRGEGYPASHYHHDGPYIHERPEHRPQWQEYAEPRIAADGWATIQLGAFSSAERAEGAWEELLGWEPELGQLRHKLVPATVGGRRLFRVRASGSSAGSICRELARRGLECWSVRS